VTTYIGAPYNTPQTITNAEFQAFCTSIKNALVAAGLVQTADTGQMNTATITWPGTTSTNAGYLVFWFNDSLQGTSPIYLKLSLGRGASNTLSTIIQLQLGQGTNGAGTLTGTLSSILTCNNQSQTSLAVTNTNQDYAVVVEGFCALFSRVTNTQFSGNCAHFFSVERSRDPSTGAFDGLGAFILYRTSNVVGPPITRGQAVRWASSPFTGVNNGSICICPGIPANTALLSGDKQLYPHFYNLPDVRQTAYTFTVRQSEFTSNPTTFTATPYGATPHTFMNLGISLTYGLSCNIGDDTNFCACVLWE